MDGQRKKQKDFSFARVCEGQLKIEQQFVQFSTNEQKNCNHTSQK